MPAKRVSYRVAVGYGLGIGGHVGTFDLGDGTLSARSAIGSEGDTLTVQAWVDDWIAEDWSIGLEYLYLNNHGKFDLLLPNGYNVLTDPITAHAYAEAHGHIGFVNVAYRPVATSLFRPFIGGGLGLGWGIVDTNLSAEIPFVSSFTSTYKSDGNWPFAAVQGFIGLDMQLYRRCYLSMFGKYVWIPGHPLNVPHRYTDVVFGVAIGRTF